MVNCYRKEAILLMVFCSLWGRSSPVIAASEVSQGFELNQNSATSQKLEVSGWVSATANECQVINPTYQEVYSFETENYQINICQLGSNFYYHRQSKSNQGDTVLIPAQPLSRGHVFQASDGRTTYFVGMNGDRYYSSVMQNNNEIVFEPEVQLPTSDLSQNIAEANSILPTDWSSNQTNNASLELDNSEDVSEQELICIREKSVDPNLNGWHKLIGKSAATANKYAVNKGYDFIYSEQTPHLASIITENGAVINLSIAAASETVERVCIQPEALSSEQ